MAIQLKDVLNSNLTRDPALRTLKALSEYAISIGYSYVSWNGDVYDTKTKDNLGTFNELGIDVRSKDYYILKDLKEGIKIDDVLGATGYLLYSKNGLLYTSKHTQVPTLDFKNIFNSNHKSWNHIDGCASFAKDAGYSYFAWNGFVIDTTNQMLIGKLNEFGLDSKTEDGNVFNSGHKLWGHLNTFYDAFKESGYPLFTWNDRLYGTDGTEVNKESLQHY